MSENQDMEVGMADETFRIYSPDSLGAAIKHYRARAGLSQVELAERCGIHRSYLSALEQGRETEQLRRLFRVFRELGLRMSVQEADW